MFDALSSFHFAAPGWLPGLLAPLAIGLWLRKTAPSAEDMRIRRYADPHLLPHLLGREALSLGETWRRFRRWSLLWTLLILAMAGPRWDFTNIQLFHPGSNLVVLFDISRSMEVPDVRPTRLARARQELEDLLEENRGNRIGLVAFSSVAHVVAPITEDTQSIRRLLPALDTQLAKPQLQGSRLTAAFDRAEHLLESQPKDSAHAILLITDGDFEEPELPKLAAALASKGIRVHVLGVGSLEGGTVPGQSGKPLLDSHRIPVQSRLNVSFLESLAQAGQGIYRTADYRDDDTREILSVTGHEAPTTREEEEVTRVWNERFYLLAGLVMLMLLPRFRRAGALTSGKTSPRTS